MSRSVDMNENNDADIEIICLNIHIIKSYLKILFIFEFMYISTIVFNILANS